MRGGLVGSAITRLVLVAQDPPADVDPTTGKGPEWGKAAPIGLLIILLMGVALYFLIKSMNRNLRKVPTSFDQPGDVDVAVDVDPAGDDAGVAARHSGGTGQRADPRAGSAADHLDRPGQRRPG